MWERGLLGRAVVQWDWIPPGGRQGCSGGEAGEASRAGSLIKSLAPGGHLWDKHERDTLSFDFGE